MQGRGSVAVALIVLASMVTGDSSNCEYNTCSECISTPSCIWCSDKNITSVVVDTGGPLPRCINKQSPNIDKFRDACKDAIHDPPTELTEEAADPSSGEDLSPQQVNLKMRAGESKRITLSYEHQVNYPMDLYCLMDGSKSMSALKNKLSSVTDDLIQGLMEITANVQLGFGMFVEKAVLPYTDMNSWKYRCDNCTETFSFKNILPLTTNKVEFQDKVLNTPSSTNSDIPEGTLDALMQVASCTTEVGWREKALKVVVVFTDAGFHLAGDGRLAGIVRPNDKECHLDDEGSYTHSVWQDYPSVNELKSVLKSKSVTTTFAVSKALVSLYELLANQLVSATCSDMDEHDNIVNLIVKPVKEQISTVTLSPTDSIPGVVVKVSSKCKGGTEQDTDTCREMLTGDEAEFFLDVKIEECPTDLQQTLMFEIGTQKFQLDLEILCQCKCEEDEVEDNAAYCSNQGDLKCGACFCYDGYIGDRCQCTTMGETEDIDKKNCILPNATELCSGQGSCVCGQCKCSKRPDPDEEITGHFCQCTNYHKDCQGNNGKICSGHGDCKCNKCDCFDGWEGQVCSCSSYTDNCKANEGEETCSGHGKCVCNKCECVDDHEGKHCENCKFCEAECEQHKPCVECLVFQTGIHAGATCEDACSSYKVTIISDMTKEYGYLCSSSDEDDCRFLYQYKENLTEIFVWATNQKECPIVVNPWIVVGGVLGGVVLVGLLLLLAWKIITSVKDKKEYQAFLIQKDCAVWNDNVSPLYKPATTQVTNPLFEGTATDRR